MAISHADLGRIRDQVGQALEAFLGQQRAVLGGIGQDLLPGLDAIAGLLAGGKRLRPAFCYWGWRAARRRGLPADATPRRPRSSCCTRARWCTTT